MKTNKDRKSLCEESMLIFVNILKLSSLSLSRKPSSSDHDHDHDHDEDDDHDDQGGLSPRSLHVPDAQKSKMRSVKAEQAPESKLSYVMIPKEDVSTASISTVDGKFADYIRRFHEKTKKEQQNAIVEGKAEDYIKRFHQKNLNDLNNESMRRSHFVLPSPPPCVVHSNYPSSA